MEYSKSVAIQLQEAIDMKYVDRGDPAAPDFLVGAFTTDGLWHDIDLSAIVPPEAANHLVHIGVDAFTAVAGSSMRLAKTGNVNDWNSAGDAYTGVSPSYALDCWVMLDANRKIRYMFSNVAWAFINLTIRGWWTD